MGRLHVFVALLGLSGLSMPSVVEAEVLATCGASAGKAYFVDQGGTWRDDRISRGSFSITVDARGNPNVLFEDALGGVVDAAADGAATFLMHLSSNKRDFMLMVAYEKTGVAETFNVITGPDGTRQALWTTSRPHGSVFPKVAAFRAVCD